MIIDEIKKRANPLESYQDLDGLLESIGNIPTVLLGEATHGTSEFYSMKTELTKRLILEKGFTSIAVPADWPPCYEINLYIKGKAHQQTNLASLLVQSFNYYPTWTWANQEVITLIEWLKEYNQKQTEDNKVGFYGIDVKSLWESMEEVIRYLDQTGSQEELALARKVYSSFEPYNRNPQLYGLNAMFFNQSCKDVVAEFYRRFQESRKYQSSREEDDFSAEMNALVMLHAEQYFRAMATDGPDCWNSRVYHMVDAINRIIDHHGQQGKVIVWGHNTHLGDARATGMSAEGLVNGAQILREQKGTDKVYAIGFSTYSGSVIASAAWGEPFEEVEVPPAHPGSWDALLHEASPKDKILIFHQDESIFRTTLPQRAIGVVYQPQSADYQTYVETRLSDRYNALIYLNHTHALKPLLPKK